jgi:hypothetical protein
VAIDSKTDEMVEDILDGVARTSSNVSDMVRKSVEEWAIAKGKEKATAEKLSQVAGETTENLQNLGQSFVDAIKTLGTSNAEFTQLNGIIGAVGKSVSGLLSAIPLIGGVFSKMADGATEAVQFAVGQVQMGYTSFLELGQVGLIGAKGIEGLAEAVDKANIPLATYASLLQKNAQNLAYFGGSATKGGKIFTDTMSMLQSEQGDQLRYLGFSIDEIGQTVADFAVRQRRLGSYQQMDADVLAAKTREYGIELDQIAKLTGQSREALQKELDDQMRDSRYRAFLTTLSEDERLEHQKYIAALKQSSPELAKAAMDTAAGFYNTDAAIQAAVGGWTQTFQRNNDLIKRGGDAMDAYGNAIEQARTNVDPKGWQRTAALVMGENSPAMAFAGQMELAGKEIINFKDIISEQNEQRTNTDETTKKLTLSMKDLEVTISNINTMFMDADIAVGVIDGFSTALRKATEFVLDLTKDSPLESKNKGVPSYIGTYTPATQASTTENLAGVQKRLRTLRNEQQSAEYNPDVSPTDFDAEISRLEEMERQLKAKVAAAAEPKRLQENIAMMLKTADTYSDAIAKLEAAPGGQQKNIENLTQARANILGKIEQSRTRLAEISPSTKSKVASTTEKKKDDNSADQLVAQEKTSADVRRQVEQGNITVQQQKQMVDLLGRMDRNLEKMQRELASK